MPHRWLRMVAACLVPLVLASSCGYGPMRRTLHEPPAVKEISRKIARDGFLKAHLRDGDVVLFSTWRVDEANRTISGEGWRFEPSRTQGASGPITLGLDSVVIFESDLAPERLHPVIQGLLVTVGIVAAIGVGIAIYLAACGKSCTGSCPTFYVWNGHHYVLAAEGFSSSVAPSLEATDLDALPEARPAGREVEVVMLNEALETHVVRWVRLIAVPRAENPRVFATPQRDFYRTGRPLAPVRALASEGDCSTLLAELDGSERSSRTDSTDLARRESIELEFDATSTEPAGLVVAARQTLVTTYLFYQTLAWMGRSAPRWIAALETAPPAVRGRAGELGDLLGGIRVEVHDPDKGWVAAGEIRETGPLAVDVRVLPLPEVRGGVRRVRLTMAKGLWRLDQVALTRLEGKIEPLRLDPIRAERSRPSAGANSTPLDLPLSTLVTLPGDRTSLIYQLPGNGAEYELFLESRGYYLEWIRQEWLAEENESRLLAMLADPRGMLRTLAPAFKRQEAEQEARFWEVVRGRL